MYRIVPDDEIFEQIAALPTAALSAYFEVLDVLQLTPWNGEPQNSKNPGGEVRRWHFGPGLAGQVVYLILEDRQEVHVLMVQWLGVA